MTTALLFPIKEHLYEWGTLLLALAVYFGITGVFMVIKRADRPSSSRRWNFAGEVLTRLLGIAAYGFVGLFIAAIVVVAAKAQPPAGFRESARLEVPASFVAGRPATVWCAPNMDAWGAAVLAGGVQTKNTDMVRGLSHIAAGEILLPPSGCAVLERWTPRSRVTIDFATALDALVHEATHVSGLRDELVTECLARKRVAEVAIRFFGFKPRTAKIRELVADVAYDYVPVAASC